jgi:hypothetical protein
MLSYPSLPYLWNVDSSLHYQLPTSASAMLCTCHGKSLVNRYRDFWAFILCGSAVGLMETLPHLPGHFFRAQLDNSISLSWGIGGLMKDFA